MIFFTLERGSLIERELPTNMMVFETHDLETITHCIDLFNSEIKWNDMFDLHGASMRMKSGEKMFVGYYEGQVFGYCWLRTIDLNNYYIYNVFSKTTKNHRQYGATDMLYFIIKNHTRGMIVANVDDWNTKSINVFTKLGFKFH